MACGNVRREAYTGGCEAGYADHTLVARTLSASFCLAMPYHALERGLNEHTNGPVGQYFLKSNDFRKARRDNQVERRVT